MVLMKAQISTYLRRATTAFNPGVWFFNTPVVEEERLMVENKPFFDRILSNLPR
jgi:hypothetical protein